MGLKKPLMDGPYFICQNAVPYDPIPRLRLASERLVHCMSSLGCAVKTHLLFLAEIKKKLIYL